MKSTKKVKHVSQKLNDAQQEAIQQAKNGNYMALLQRVFETDRAISRIEGVRQDGTQRWCDKMIAHYCEIGEYMFSFLPKTAGVKAFTDQYEFLGKEKSYGNTD